MRKAAITMAVILFVMGCLWIYGCGSNNDILDEGRIRYAVYVMTQNNGDNTEEVDVIQNYCDANGTTVEDFLPFGAEITVEANTDTPDLVIDSYEVTFTPVRGTYFSASANAYIDVTPPALPALLNPIVDNVTQPKIMANGSLTFDISIWDAALKIYYMETFLRITSGLNNMVTPPGYLNPLPEAWTSSFTYEYRLVLRGHDSAGEDITLEAQAKAIFANFDTCSGSS